MSPSGAGLRKRPSSQLSLMLTIVSIEEEEANAASRVRPRIAPIKHPRRLDTEIRAFHFLTSIGALPLLAPGLALADQFPSGPIRIIVPASPDTSTDAITRFFAHPLSNNLKAWLSRTLSGTGLLAYREAAGQQRTATH